MNQTIQLSVSIPENRVGEFYELLGIWLQSSEGKLIRQVRPEGLIARRFVPQDERRDWSEGTTEEQQEDAKNLYAGLSPKARQIANYLLDRPGRQVPALELAQLVGGESPHIVAGALSSFGRQGRKVNRKHPFTWIETENGETLYSISPGIAELFAPARSRAPRAVLIS